MRLRMQRAVTGLLAGVMLSGALAVAQGSGKKDDDLNLELHANGHTSASEIGLPVYPGATLYKGKDKKNDSQADLGFTFGDFHMEVIAIGYVTHDPAAKVLKFYRKPLSRYGQVLECDHGKPVGKLTVTNTGLTCSDNDNNGHVQVNGSPNSSDDIELRAGWPHKFRLVGIDSSHAGETQFGLVYLELPRDKDRAKAE